MTDKETIRRIVEEAKRLGGEKELYRQFSLNMNLEDRTAELETSIEASRQTINGLDKTIQGRLEDDRKSQQKHEDLLLSMKEEHAQFVNNANAERTRLTSELEGIKQDIATSSKERAGLGAEITLGGFYLSLIHKDPKTLQLHKKYLSSLMDPQAIPDAQLTEAVAYRAICDARDWFTRSGLLVPLQELKEAKRETKIALQQAQNDRFLRTYMLRALGGFVHNPANMSPEQKRVLLEAYAQIRGDTLEGFNQLMKWIEGSEVCIFHKCAMVFDYQQRLWRCPVFTCTSKR